MVCRVCLKHSEIELQIFDEKGVKQRIPQILQLHLWFTPTPDDPISKAICLRCWFKLLEFHQFYEAAKEAHKFYQSAKTLKHPVEIVNHEDANDEIWVDNGEDIDTQRNKNDNTEMITSFYEPKLLEPNTIKTESPEANELEEYLANGKAHEFYQDLHEIVINAQNATTLSHPVEIVVKHEDVNDEIWIDEGEDIDTQRNKNDKTEINSSLNESEILEPITISPEANKLDEYVANDKGIRKRARRVAYNFQIDSADDDDNDGESSDGNRDFDADTDSHSENEPEKTMETIEVKNTRNSKKTTTANATETAKRDRSSVEKALPKAAVKVVNKSSAITTNKREHEKHCDRYLKDEENLKVNLRRHKEANEIISCELCGKVVKTRSALTGHKNYTHTGEQFNCNLCSKTFTRKISLKEHIASHLGEPLYKCPFCARTFNSSANMYSHRKKKHPLEYENLRKKHETNQLNCNLCSKTFKRKLSLKEHMASHLGEELYKCPFCARTSNSSANMYSHRKKQHPIEYEIWRKTKSNLFPFTLAAHPHNN